MKTLLIIATVLIGSSAAWADLCQACKGKAYTADIGTCAQCRKETSSGAFKLCKACSAKLGECEHCRKKLALTIGKDSDGQTVEAKDVRTIRIEIAGNKTSGYSWAVAKIDGESLKQAGEIAYIGPKDPRPGAGGTFVATFSAVKSGKTTITMDCRRPWEKDVKPVETFTITIDVKGPADALKKDLKSVRIRIESLTLSVPESESGQGETLIRITPEQAAKIIDLVEWDEAATDGPSLEIYNQHVDVPLPIDAERLKKLRPALEGEALKALNAQIEKMK